jgi:NTE family protein
MNTSPSPRRALVLGGGGSTGNAWLIGIIAGLAEGGLDVTTADLTIGTSAGATAAAQLAGTTPADLLAVTVDTAPPPGGGPTSVARGLDDHLARMGSIIAASAGLADMRRRFGALALEADAREGSQRWRAVVAARLPGARWPDHDLLLTAVDARTGGPIAFGRDSGVDLVDAVAASTAGGGFAYRIGDGRYIDGGYRTNAENADLAAGYDRVLVLSPLGGRSLHPEEWGTHLSAQVDELRAGGSRVEVVTPASGAGHLFGARAMDASLRPAAARAGREQGLGLAERLAGLWG